MHTHTYTRTHGHTHKRIHAHACTHTCKCAHAHTCIHTHTHTHTCKHTHTHTHASAHMHTLSRTRACTHARARGRTGLLHFTNVETGLEGLAGFWGKRVVDRGWELVSIFASVPHGGALIARGGPEIQTGYACWFQNGLVWHGLLGRSRCFLCRRKSLAQLPPAFPVLPGRAFPGVPPHPQPAPRDFPHLTCHSWYLPKPPDNGHLRGTPALAAGNKAEAGLGLLLSS